MTLGAGSRCQESTVITFEWDLMGLKEIFESSKDDEKSPLIASSLFGGGKWQLHFYASAARASSCSLYIAAIPTAEELRQGAQNCLSQGGWPREGPHWARRGPFSFTFEIKSLDGTIPIVARGPHEPMVRREFTSSCSTWGYPQYVRRTEIFGDRAIAKANNGVKIICTMTYPLSPLPLPPAPTTTPMYRTVSVDIMDTVIDLFDNPTYSDVVFKFPKRDGSGFKSIYASKKILTRRSEYFRSLFDGGFAESLSPVARPTFCPGPIRPTPVYGNSLSARISNPPSRLNLKPVYDELDEDDSDADSDYADDCDSDAEFEANMEVELPRAASPIVLSPRPPQMAADAQSTIPSGEDIVRAMTPESVKSDCEESPQPIRVTKEPLSSMRSMAPPATPSMQTIVIRDAAYLTYRALLFALYTDEISFAPLSSTYHTDRTAAYKNDFDFPYPTRKAYVRSRIPTPKTEAQKKAPFPCSAKSLYKLADKLDLQRVKARSFQAIRESLNARNVASELFGSFSALFPEVRKVQMDYMLNHWEEVSHSDGLMYDMNPFNPSSSFHSFSPLPTARSRGPPTSTGYSARMQSQHRTSMTNQEVFIQLLHALRPKSRRSLAARPAGPGGMAYADGDDTEEMTNMDAVRYEYELEA
ncbi:hypothetical protein M407DRAFT_228734 [Tulasnella calospora MUT 4182]|uniref:BTB domain-containing protein n=1 Tax=Tulasnella calospora MUT 4182 TaxID=1051891 RepID=A0A0C3M615_9AGAM|nr:hypothetical protein M407DRAFT_228734 [Tulasnella calospora MUT 4182]